MFDTQHVVLIHGSWSRGEQWSPARAALEHRGYTVHAPTLRHHQLPVEEGATKIAQLSLRDYADDLVAMIASLDSPPLLVGHSLGGLLVQLVAARTHPAGMVVACPSSVGPSGLNPTTAGLSFRHALQPRPWVQPVYPPSWKRFRRGVAKAQTAEVAREVFADLVCESGRALFFELAIPWLDRARAATVDFAAVSAPVLVVAGERDRIIRPRSARKTAARYENTTYVEIPRSDHLVFFGDALPVTMRHIDDWITKNHVFGTS